MTKSWQALASRELGLSPEELDSVHLYFHDQRQSEATRQALATNVAYVDVLDDPFSLGLLGGALGAAFPAAFGAGAVAGGAWFTALLGAGIGYKLGTILQKQDEKKKQIFAPSYNIDSGGQLTTLGGAIPLVYCNRTANTSGGVRFGGNLVQSRITTYRGEVLLSQLYCVGVGPMGAIDPGSVLLDDTPLNQFLANDVIVYFMTGTDNQNGLFEFNKYSQVRSSNNLNALGYDKRAKNNSTTSAAVNGIAVFNSSINCYLTNNSNTVTKNFASNAYDSGGQSSLYAENNGSYLEWQALETNTRRMAGLSTDSAYSLASVPNIGGLNYAIEMREDGTYRVYENGTQKYTSGALTYPPNSIFRVEIATGGNIFYKLNGTAFYTSTTVNPSFPLYPVTCHFTNGSTVHNIQLSRTYVYPSGNVSAINNSTPGQSVLTIRDDDEETLDDFTRFTTSEIYQVVANGTVQEFRIIAKYPTTNQFVVTPQVSIPGGVRIDAIFRSKFESSKRVSELHFNLAATLWSRLKPTNGEKQGLKGGKSK